MRAHLTEANHDLLYQIEVLQELIGQAKVSGELAPYLGQISSLCAGPPSFGSFRVGLNS